MQEALAFAVLLTLAVPVSAQEPCACVCCLESVNPHGQTIPPAGWTTAPGLNPKSGVNPDGFYQLCLYSTCPVDLYVGYAGNPKLFLVDPGIVVKFTEAPGAAPQQKQIGSTNGQAGAVIWHFILPGDPLISAYCRTTGILLAQTTCPVPPPPK